MKRRTFVAATAGLAALAAAPRDGRATPAEADAMVRKLIGAAQPAEGRIQLQIKDVADSGTSEPVAVEVDSPQTAASHVAAIHVVAEGNPAPGVASFFLSPRNGKARVAFRMRLAKTQVVRAYAVMNDGKVFMAAQEVKVTIGGCGG